MDWLRGRRVLVTGASSGIGAGLAEAMAAAGAVVGICARRQDRLAETLERCRAHSPESRMWVVDLADLSQVDRLATAAAEELGGVDVLVNNAGIPKRRQVTALDFATVESVMNINYFSPVRLTLALLPGMVERGWGKVISVSSVAATLSSPGESAYDGSKAALAAFSESMAVDLWDTGVKVTVVFPGVVDTELFSLPDNDPSIAAVEALTVAEAVEAVLDGAGADRLNVYVPSYFADLAAAKAQDVEGFMAGAAEFVRQQQASAT
jgi:short-subunit dehydrogenase